MNRVILAGNNSSVMETLIQNISDTALWVAIFRADESERPDAIFKDPYARRLAGDRGAKIADAIEFSRKNSWSFVTRTVLFDQFVTRYVEEGYDMVINLAAGLDTRPYRMFLPQTLKWIEIDLPGIIDYKEGILAGEKSRCSLEKIRLDLSDRPARRTLFKELGKKAEKALIISEGLMIYLDEQEAGALANDLSTESQFNHWVLDLASPGLLAMAQKEMGSFLEKGSFRFAPREGEGFFLHHGWNNIESRSLFNTAAGLNRLSAEMIGFAAVPEPEGPKGDFPWSGVCLFENINR